MIHYPTTDKQVFDSDDRKRMDLENVREAARSSARVAGWTHDFYAYPARFSPVFASEIIRAFSGPGDTVLDPFIGGGTTAVEAIALGRHVIGSDLNELAVFVSRLKTTALSNEELQTIRDWMTDVVPRLHYWHPRDSVQDLIEDERTRNLNLPRARPLRKAIALALRFVPQLPTCATRDFARGVILRTAQRALDNRKRTTSLSEFRSMLEANSEQMLAACRNFFEFLDTTVGRMACDIVHTDASDLPIHPLIVSNNRKADLVLASPPYPGIHVLYHRWQVDGRRETPAPYWIAGCNDGKAGTYYTFADRRERAMGAYFERLRDIFQSIRQVIKDGGHVVQMVSFANRKRHLPRYLRAMVASGFEEIRSDAGRRIWRDVPNRKWHATMKGRSDGAREVVLIHRAV